MHTDRRFFGLLSYIFNGAILVLIIGIGQYLVDPEDIRDVVQNAMEQIVGNAGVEQLNLMVDSAVSAMIKAHWRL
ncbi:MAG: hypothetical protein U0905_12205 [Pirellulales bacterium]